MQEENQGKLAEVFLQITQFEITVQLDCSSSLLYVPLRKPKVGVVVSNLEA